MFLRLSYVFEDQGRELGRDFFCKRKGVCVCGGGERSIENAGRENNLNSD